MPQDVSLIPGVVNFRDTGGLPAAGGLTRHGVLYRSGNLATVSDAAALAALGLRRIIDLRDDEEVVRDRSLTDELGVTTQRAPLQYGSIRSFFESDVSIPDFYRAIVDDAADAVVAVVRGVIAEHPALVHCTIGKDRTGVAIGVMLAAAGVDEDAVVADYARTEALLPADRNAQIVAFIRSAHPGARHLVDLATRSPAAAMRTLLDDLAARFGGAAGYLRAHGVTDDELAALREVLIAPAQDPVR